jgi:hypothetical protein
MTICHARSYLPRFVLLLITFLLPAAISAQVSLQCSPNPSVMSAPVNLQATVPSGATGWVTFYDGVSILGSKQVGSNAASLTTSLLASGVHALHVHYSGDQSHAAANSATVSQTITALATNVLVPGPVVPAGYGKGIVGDFNGDGIPDQAVLASIAGSSTITIFLGHGDGTYQAGLVSSPGYYLASIAAADFNRDGKLDLATTDNNNNHLIVLLGNGDGTFQAYQTYQMPTSGYLPSVNVNDLNGDGLADLVVFDHGPSYGQIVLYLGRGDGTFQSSASYGLSQRGTALVIDDFNNDGKPDVVVLYATNNSPYTYGGGLIVLLGNGDGTLLTPVQSQLTLPLATVINGDFNADGKTDLMIVANVGVQFLKGKGDGSFESPIDVATAALSAFWITSLVTGDINGDGIPDLILNALLPALNNTDRMLFLTGNGDGTFDLAGVYVAPDALQVADLNSDGRPDLIVHFPSTQPNAPNSILLGAQATAAVSGSPQTAAIRSAFAAPLRVTLTDSANHPQAGVPVTFSAPATGATAVLSGSTVTTDASGAAAVTAVANATTGSYTVTAYLGISSVQFSLTNVVQGSPATLTATPLSQIARVSTPFAMPLQALAKDSNGNLMPGVTVDFTVPSNGPGATLSSDSAVTNAYGIASVTATANSISGSYTATATVEGTAVSGTWSLTNNPAAGTSISLSTSSSVSVLGAPLNLTATVMPSTVTGKVAFYEGVNLIGTVPVISGTASLSTITLPLGAGTLTAFYGGDLNYLPCTSAPKPVVVRANLVDTVGWFPNGTSQYTKSIAVADFNKDGKADIVTAANVTHVWLGNGNGAYQLANSYAAGDYVAVGDFNGDGNPDLAVADYLRGNVAILLGNGDGSFQAPVVYNCGATPRIPVVADFNGDGNADLAIPNYFGFAIMLGNGDGTLRSPIQYSPGGQPWGIAIGDFNGDGITDLALSSSTGYVAIELGNGNGSFSAGEVYTVTFANVIASADFDRDGKVDLIVNASNGSQVLMGNGNGTFRPLATRSLGFTAVGDFDGDGILDIAGANQITNALNLFLGFGDGTFVYVSELILPESPSALALADINGDGVTDFLIANQNGSEFSEILSYRTPSLSVAVQHSPGFTRGATGVTYTITVRNSVGFTNGQVTVDDSLPAGLTATAISGSGWTCTISPLRCTRSSALLGGLSYPPIFITVNVDANAAPTLTNSVVVSGGASANATASDNVSTNPAPTITGPASLPAGTAGVAYPSTTITGTGGTQPLTWSATGLPGGLSINTASGTILGTPSSASGSPFSITVTVTDSAALAASRNYSLFVNPTADLAAGKAASQSSTYPGFPASVVADANTDGDVTHGSVSVTNLDANAWWQVDLGGSVAFNSVAIWNRTDCCGSRLADYWLFISDTPFAANDTPSTLQNRAGTWSSHQTTAPNPYVFISAGNAQGRYVRVQLSGSNYLSLAEVQVFGAFGTLGTLAIFGPASLPAGTVGVAYTSTVVTASGGQQPYTWSSTGLPGGLSINSTTGAISGTPSSATGSPFRVTVTATDAASTTANQNYSLTVSVPQSGSNLALGKSATQSSTYPGYPASVVVDGNTDGNIGDGSVSVTNANPNAWWQADLGASATVNSIVIWNRTDCCSSRLSDYWVFVSDTPFDPTDTPATLQGRAGTWSSHQTSAPSPSANIPAGAQGRYVRVQLSGTNYLSLAEVQAFGTIGPASLSITGPVSLPQGTVGVAYSPTAVNAIGGSTPYSWSATGLPAGLTINSGTGMISGTPGSATGSPFTVNVTVIDNVSATVSQNYLLTIDVPQSGTNLAQGKSATQSSTYTGFPASLAVDGNINGSAGAGSVTVTNFDANAWWQVDLGASATLNNIVVFNRTDCCGSRLSDYWVFVSDTPFAPTDTPATLQNRAATWSNHQTVSPLVLTQIPTTAQGRYLRVQLSGANYLSLAEVQVYGTFTTLNLGISGPASIPASTAGVPYPATTITAVGGTPQYTWSAAGLPSGMSINPSTGVISGTPGAPTSGAATVSVTVTDGAAATASTNYSLTINSAPSVTGPASLPPASVGVAYAATTVSATGGTPPYTWSSNGLPAQMSINASTGTISGTPGSAAGSPLSVTIYATDTASAVATQVYSLTVLVPLSITGPASLSAGTVGTVYTSTTVTATGGSGGNTWSASGLPGGLAINNSTGVITGTPNTAVGSPFSVTVTVHDNSAGSATRDYSLAISAQITGSNLALGKTAAQSTTYPGFPASLALDGNTSGNASAGSVTVTNGDAYGWWQVDLGSSATLSSVVIWNRTDCCGSRLGDYWVFVSDTPFSAGDTPATLQSRAGTWSSHQTIAPNPSSIIAAGAQGRYLRVQLSGTNYLSLAEVQVFGSSVPLTLSISGPASLPAGVAGSSYSPVTISATGGTGTYNWSATGLPPGLGINPNIGAITGTPTTATGSPFSVTVTVTDSDSATAIQNYSLVITTQSAANLALGKSASQSTTYPGYPASLAVDGNINGNMSAGSVTVTNGDANGWWQVDLGASFTLSSIIIWNRTDCCGSRLGDYWIFVSDTPFAANDTPATLQNRPATWNNHQTTAPNPSSNIGASGAQGRYLRVQLSGTNYLSLAEVQVFGGGGSIPLAITGPASLPAGVVGTSYTPTTLTATGGTGPYTWSASGLPSGLGIDPGTGAITGIPATATGSPFSVSVSVTDNVAGHTTQNYSLIVSPPQNSGNLALGKSVSQSSTYPGYPASLANDGNTFGNVSAGSVTVTNADANPWWQVDLGTSAALNQIVIWNRTDCCSSRLSDYWVFVSDTPFTDGDTPTILQNRPGTWFVHQTAAPNPAATISASGAQGRYVRIQLSGSNYLSLAEVQIY